MKISLWFVVRPAFARYNSIACKFTLVSTHEDCYPSFGNVSYKSTRDRGQTKNHGDSMVGVIVTSNRCELEPLENEVDYTISTIEELLKILPEKFETEGEEERNGYGFNY